MVCRERTLYLDTTGDLFVQWLGHHTRWQSENGELDFPTQEDLIRLAPTTHFYHPGGTWEIHMSAYRIVRPGEDEESREKVGSAISFWALTLARERLEVNAECCLPVVADYFDALLIEIEKALSKAEKVAPGPKEPKEAEAHAGRLSATSAKAVPQEPENSGEVYEGICHCAQDAREIHKWLEPGRLGQPDSKNGGLQGRARL